MFVDPLDGGAWSDNQEKKIEGVLRLNWLQCIVYNLVIFYCEYQQYVTGESFRVLVTDTLFYCTTWMSFASWKRSWILNLLLFTFIVTETASWVTTNRGICTQAVVSLTDYRYLFFVRPDFFAYGCIAFVVSGFLLSRPFPERFNITIPVWPSVLRLIALVLGFQCLRNVRKTLVPFESSYNVEPDNPLLKTYLTTPASVNSCPAVKKNLIFIHLECFEFQSLGPYNKFYPELAPHFTKYALNGLFFANHTADEEQHFTMGSVMSAQGGVPILSANFFQKSTIVTNKRVKTISDFLQLCGWKVYATCTSFCSPYKFFRLHHMKTIDATTHGQKRDYGHFEYVKNDLLPKLMAEKEPFYLFIMNEDTHPGYYVSPECLQKHPEWKNLPVGLQAVNCVDEYTAGLVERIRELGLDKNTEVFLYGDHELFGQHSFYPPPRKLLSCFPFRDKLYLNKSVSWYDLAPTVLNMLNVTDYQPKFPFGADIFGPEVEVHRPTGNDRAFINNVIH